VIVRSDAGPEPSVDEEALVHSAQGDRAAFAPLYERYVDRVYAYLRARTASEEDAADLTQQVFLRVLDALPRTKSQHLVFAPWLFRIARNAAIDAHRRHRDSVAWDLLPLDLHPTTNDDLDASLMRAEAGARLREQLQCLSLDTREMLALRFGVGLSVAEVAVVMGKSEAAVKQQIVRTVRKLRTQYDDTAY